MKCAVATSTRRVSAEKTLRDIGVSDYCQRVYLQYARPTEQISSTDKYYCRGDRKKVVLDRAAMLMASRALGHNRIDVIASHYLYNLQ